MSDPPSSMFDKLAQRRQKKAAQPSKGDEAPETPKRQGRSKGKRSDPDYEQVGAYIPKELNKQVKRLLIDEDMDFSDLVAALLEEWVNRKTD